VTEVVAEGLLEAIDLLFSDRAEDLVSIQETPH